MNVETDALQLFHLIREHFSLDELRAICLEVGIEFEDLREGGEEAKTLDLVEKMQRRNRLAELAAVCARERPHLTWPGRTAAATRLAAMPTDHVPPPSDLPPGSRMPFRHNPLFVGREEELLVLARALKTGDDAIVGQAATVTGMGGVGKTQLAVEFACRYGRYFPGGVFWLSFAEVENVPIEVAACGGKDGLNLPGWERLDVPTQVERIRLLWREATPRLLIFDNCELPGLLQQWRLTVGGCRVLATSRRAEWAREMGITPLALPRLPRPQSVALLQGYRAMAAKVADEIAEEVGDLPLALHLVGSFLRRYQIQQPETYLAALRDKGLAAHPSLQGRGSTESPTKHDLDVWRTFAVSVGALKTEEAGDALARALLAQAACFAPGEMIPWPLLLLSLRSGPAPRSGRSLTEPEMADGEGAQSGDRPQREDSPQPENFDELEAEEAAVRLAELGLVEWEEGGGLTLHRLVAAYAQTLAGADEARAAVEETLLQEARRLNNTGFPGPLLAWQAHLRHVTDAAQKREDETAANLCNEMGYHLRMIGDYRGARPYYERALAIDEGVLGPNLPDIAIDLNNLGRLLKTMGDYEGARPYLERALAIREKVLGADHPLTADSLNSLGMLLQAMGDYEGARPQYERALAIWEKVLGADHPTTAISLNNLGRLLKDIGDYAGARPYLERALAIKEKVLVVDHPLTASSLNNLGALLYAMGDTEGARAYYERALAIDEKVLGPEHPLTATSLNNLGSLLKDMGELAEARPYLERALHILETKLGPNHPNTRIVRDNLDGLDAQLPGS